MSLQALLNPGDEVLIPAPDYPLWTATVNLSGGTSVHYRCDESNDWQPDLEHLADQVSDRTKAIVVINPNNPTGAVYPRSMLESLAEFARQHDLVIFADEIYDKILYDDAEHTVLATLAPDVFCLTFSGLSKSYRVAGFRAGWVVVSGPKEHAQSYISGLSVLANMRLCPNVPSQHAIQTALGGYQSINELILPGGRLLAQRDTAYELLNAIPGVSCTKPKGALYVFPRLDPEVYPIADDMQFTLDLLRAEKILVTYGTGFNWPTPDHIRIVTLPSVEVLTDAITRIGDFLSTYAA
jgi:alanine-synthesizing transaminase